MDQLNVSDQVQRSAHGKADLMGKKSFKIPNSTEPTDLKKAVLLSMKQEAWGNRCVYSLPEEIINKSEWQEWIYVRGNYGVHAESVKRDAAGKATVEIFWSIGD